MSELTQLIIRNKAAQHSWPIASFVPKDNQKISLPSDIFLNLSNPQAGVDVSSTMLTLLIWQNVRVRYLSDEIAEHVKGLGRRGFVAVSCHLLEVR